MCPCRSVFALYWVHPPVWGRVWDEGVFLSLSCVIRRRKVCNYQEQIMWNYTLKDRNLIKTLSCIQRTSTLVASGIWYFIQGNCNISSFFLSWMEWSWMGSYSSMLWEKLQSGWLFCYQNGNRQGIEETSQDYIFCTPITPNQKRSEELLQSYGYRAFSTWYLETFQCGMMNARLLLLSFAIVIDYGMDMFDIEVSEIKEDDERTILVV